MAQYTPPFSGWDLFGLGLGLAGGVLVVGLVCLVLLYLYCALVGSLAAGAGARIPRV